MSDEVDELPADAVSQSEAARLIRVHPNTIGRWIRSGAVAAWRKGHRVFLSASEVRAQIRRVQVEDVGERVRTPAEERAAGDAAAARVQARGWGGAKK